VLVEKGFSTGDAAQGFGQVFLMTFRMPLGGDDCIHLRTDCRTGDIDEVWYDQEAVATSSS
jgi:hypothetical protein